MNTKLLVLSLLSLSIFALIVFAASSQNSPTACAGQWSSCTDAFADNANRATAQATNTVNRSGIWNNYGFIMFKNPADGALTRLKTQCITCLN